MLKVNIRQLTNEGFDFTGKISREDLGLTISDPATEIVFDDSAEYNLHISSVSDGVLVSGKASVGVKADCGRCLENYHFILTNEVCHFYEHVKGDDLDIADEIREDLLISLPTKYLCSEKCSGICTSCGKNLNNEKCDCKIENVTFEDDENPWNELDNLDL